MFFGKIFDKIFVLKDREKSLELIDHYSGFWRQMKAGQGFSGKKTLNSSTKFAEFFSVDSSEAVEDEVIEDSDDAMAQVLDILLNT